MQTDFDRPRAGADRRHRAGDRRPPNLHTVLATRVLHAFASCLLSPAIAALTLTMFGHDLFSEQLGSDRRYTSLGSAFAAAALGGVACYMWFGRSRVHRRLDRAGAAHIPRLPRQRPRRGRHRRCCIRANARRMSSGPGTCSETGRCTSSSPTSSCSISPMPRRCRWR